MLPIELDFKSEFSNLKNEENNLILHPHEENIPQLSPPGTLPFEYQAFMDEEAPLVYSIKTEDKSDVGDTSNVEYVELLECDEGLMTLSDGTNWYKVPLAEGIEVTTEEDIDCKDEPPDFVDADQEPFIESDHLDEVNIDDNSQVILLGDGSLAFLETSTDTDIVENYETVVLEKETNVPNKKLRKFKCSVEGCPRSFRTSHHLKVHLRIHTGDRPYKCPMEGCEKAFSTDVARKSHIRTHTGEKPYPCTSISCNKSFKTSGDLQKHIRTHTGERPFSCPFKGCNKSFTTSNIRKVHLRTHTGEKPYVCEKEGCNKRFASSTNFQNHTRIHLGVKPYVCKACSKKFTEYSSLYKHRLVHSQLRRHLCNFCHKSYRQLSTLVIHQRTNHGVIYSDGSDIVFEDISSQDTNSFSNISPDV